MGQLLIGEVYPPQLYLGVSAVNKVMCGTEQVWPRKSLWEYTICIHYVKTTGEDTVSLYYNHSSHTIELSKWTGYDVDQNPAKNGVYLYKGGFRTSDTIKETRSASGLPIVARMLYSSRECELSFESDYWNALKSQGLEYDDIYVIF